MENRHEPVNFVTFTFGLKLAFLSFFTHSLASWNSIISILRDVSWQLLAVSSPPRSLDQVSRLNIRDGIIMKCTSDGKWPQDKFRRYEEGKS